MSEYKYGHSEKANQDQDNKFGFSHGQFFYPNNLTNAVSIVYLKSSKYRLLLVILEYASHAILQTRFKEEYIVSNHIHNGSEITSPNNRGQPAKRSGTGSFSGN